MLEDTKTERAKICLWRKCIQCFNSFNVNVGPCEKRSPIKHDDNLRTGEGDFVTPEKSKYIPAERPQQVKPVDNLVPEGTFDRPEKTSFKPAERPKAVKPTDQVRT